MQETVSTHMPLARHDNLFRVGRGENRVSTHMPLARHDDANNDFDIENDDGFYSHASCEA